MSQHLKRCLTAAVAIPVLILLVAKGAMVGFALVVGLVSVVSLYEYYCMMLPGEKAGTRLTGLAFCLLIAASFYTDGGTTTFTLIILAFLSLGMISLAGFDGGRSSVEAFNKHITGLVYIPFFLGHLILIRDSRGGETWIFFLMAVIFAGDIAAYYVGTSFGRHKLAPNVSPGKTVEGSLGGLAANLLVGALFKKCYFPQFGWVQWIGLTLTLGVVGQAGDLFESMFKRSAGVKDSGRIVPGHGGLLDRIDALLFAGPALYYFKRYLL